MRKFIIGFILGTMIATAVAVTRAELYKKFGPLLMEAVVLVIKDEINILRVQAGLPERTNAQILTAVETKLNTLDEYDWMKD